MVRKQYLWTDPDGVNRWHDHPEPDPRKKNKEAGRVMGTNARSTGMGSDGASVHSNQVNEFREDVNKNGFTGVDFKSDGTAVFSSRNERSRYLRHRGLYDRDAGYGDTVPDNH